MGKATRKRGLGRQPAKPYTAAGHLRGPWEKQAHPEYWVDRDSGCPNKQWTAMDSSGESNYVCTCTPPCKFALDQKQSDIDYYLARGNR